MAGDWIKMRVDLFDDPAVILIASTLDIDEDSVVGKLHRLWSWADRHTTDGNATSVSEIWIDRYLGCPGFAKAMQKCGWLVVLENGICLPEFTKHNGKTAKQRALTAKRVASLPKKTNATANAISVSDALAREEKRREENKEESPIGDSCSEPHPASSEQKDDNPVVLTFPTNGKGERSWHLRQSKIDEYAEAFPAVDVLAECRQALQWCRDNPAKRKTPAGMPAFLSKWLSREQNNPRRPKAITPSAQPPTENGFVPNPLVGETREFLDRLFGRKDSDCDGQGNVATNAAANSGSTSNCRS